MLGKHADHIHLLVPSGVAAAAPLDRLLAMIYPHFTSIRVTFYLCRPRQFWLLQWTPLSPCDPRCGSSWIIQSWQLYFKP
eukprot:scaffold274997_cov36-Tisochrysis_lutea.AAC.1